MAALCFVMFLAEGAYGATIDCAGELAKRAPVSVAIGDQLPATIAAGQPFELDWSLTNASSSRPCDARVVLVFGFANWVRITSDALIALTPGATGIYGISSFQEDARVFDELPGPTANGQIKLAMWQPGSSSVRAQAYYAWRAKTGRLTIQAAGPVSDVAGPKVVLGPGRIATEDRFDTSSALRTAVSSDGQYALKDFGAYFRVYSQSGRLVLVAGGRDASFSHDDQFIASTFEHGVDVYDLRSGGALAYRLRLPPAAGDFRITAIGWSQHDSFMILSLSSVGGLLIKPMLVDGLEWRTDNGMGDLGARRQEPGYASDVRIDPISDQFTTSYFWGELTRGVGQHLLWTGYDPAYGAERQDHEKSTTALLPEMDVGLQGDWDHVRWSPQNDVWLSADFSKAPQAGGGIVTEAAAPTVTWTGPANAAHFFYHQRLGAPGYVRYGSLFSAPLPLRWVPPPAPSVVEFLRQAGLATLTYKAAEKIYSADPDELSFLDWDAAKPLLPIIGGEGASTFTFDEVDKDELVLDDLFDMLVNEKEYTDELGPDLVTGTPDSATGERPSDAMVAFPNPVEDRLEALSTQAVLDIVGHTKAADKVLYQRAPDFQANLSSDERRSAEESQTNDCVGADGTLARILPSAVRDIWTVKVGDDRLWIFQAACSSGLRGEQRTGQITVIRVRSDGSVVAKNLGVASCGELNCNALSAELASIRVGLVGDQYLLLQGYDDSVLIYDAVADKVVGTVLRPQMGTGAFATLSSDGKTLFLLDGSGEFEIANDETANTIANGAIVGEDVIVYDQHGRFVSTEDGSSFVRVRFDGDPVLGSLRQFRRQLYDPQLLGELLSDTPPSSGTALENLPPPPELVVASQSGTTTSLTAPPYYAPSEVRAFINGGLIASIQVPAGVDTTVKFDSANQFVRVGDDGAESDPVRTAGGSDKEGRLLILALGAGSFIDPDIPPLAWAESDAGHFCQTAMSAPSSYAAKLDLSGGCTGRMTRGWTDKLRAAAESMQPEDSLFLFLSSHGVRGSDGEFYIAGPDTYLPRLEHTATSWSSIMDALSGSKGKIVLFLDACHSGQAGRLLANDDLVTSLQRNTRASIFVIAASRGRQKSYENEEGGYFEAAIGKLFQDANPLSIGSFYSKLRDDVSEATSGRQTPWFSSNYALVDTAIF